jgi:hypothetical protein
MTSFIITTEVRAHQEAEYRKMLPALLIITITKTETDLLLTEIKAVTEEMQIRAERPIPTEMQVAREEPVL